MAEEKKIYDVKGTVTISTEEYRDLITESMEKGHEADDYRHRYWEEQSVNTKLKEKIESLEKGQAHYKDFVNSSEAVQTAYQAFLRSKVSMDDLI